MLNTMPIKKRPKTKAEQEQASQAHDQEVQAQQQKAQEQKAQEAQELGPTTESSRSSGSNETYTKEFERMMLLGELREAERRGRPKPWADEAEDSGSNPTYDKSIVRPSSKKQREEDQFEEDASYLSEEDLPGIWECSDEAREIGWDSETQQAYAGAVNADAVTDGELSEESGPILQDLLFGGRGVSEMMVSHI